MVNGEETFINCPSERLKLVLRRTYYTQRFNELNNFLKESFKLGVNSTRTKNFQMYKVGLEKARNEDQTANNQQIIEKQEFQKSLLH